MIESRTVIPSVTGANISADTRYFPSTEGQEVSGAKDAMFQIKCSGGVTVTVEAHLSDEVSPTFVDITESVFSRNTGVDSAASFVDKTDILFLKDMIYDRIRLKYVTADTSNAVYFRGIIEGGNFVTN